MYRFKLGYEVANKYFRGCWRLTAAKMCQDMVSLIGNWFYLIYKYGKQITVK